MRKSITTFFIILASAAFFSTQSCKHSPDEIPIIESQDSTETEDSTSVKCDPDSVYFKNSILPLITSSCAYSGCHDATSQKDGVILDTYKNIISTGDIKPGEPASSELYQVIVESDQDKKMPPPPNSALTSKQINLIQKWIQQGAKNNECSDCDSVDVKYSKQVSSILGTSCVTCHNATSASAGVKLHDYASLKKYVDNGKLNGTINHLIGYKSMPPAGMLDACNLAIIKRWINEGAQNN